MVELAIKIFRMRVPKRREPFEITTSQGRATQAKLLMIEEANRLRVSGSPNFNNMLTTKETQTRPSLDVLDELAPGASLKPVNRHATEGVARLKMPIWDSNQRTTETSSTIRSPRRSNRSQSGSGKKPEKPIPGSITTHDGALDDNVSPTSSAPGSPLVDSPHSLVLKQKVLSPEQPEGQGLLSMTTEMSKPTAEVPLSQPAGLGCCQTRQDHCDDERQP